jgi:hypothetical protein
VADFIGTMNFAQGVVRGCEGDWTVVEARGLGTIRALAGPSLAQMSSASSRPTEKRKMPSAA